MRYKVGWLTFWVTMAYWLGGAWGCASAPEADRDTIAHEVALQLATRLAPVPGTQPAQAMEGLGRAHWPLLVVKPASGWSAHHPLYYGSAPLRCSMRSGCRMGPFEPACCAGCGDGAACQACVEPVEVLLNTASLPVELVRSPPWGWCEQSAPWYDALGMPW